MDPVTQGALGASLPQALNGRHKLRTATWLGALSGMSPDLDVLIQSPADPLLFLEFHRQFTHSLLFIPVGALICAVVLFRWAKPDLNLRETYLVCLLGYSTHALLDACTTYGTQLLWPLTDARFAWNNVSVVDPLVTLPLLALVITSAISRKPGYARAGFAWVLVYLSLGVWQQQRAMAAAEELALTRGHEQVNLSTKPGFANLLLWKSIYEYQGRYYVDAVRAGFEPRVYQGQTVLKLNPGRDLPWLDPATQQSRDLLRFDWFSSGYLALDPDDPMMVIDMRYSILPNEIKSLWGIRFDPSAPPDTHVSFISARDASPARMAQLLRLLRGD